MKFFCEYCGYNIDANVDSKCPNCGAAYNRNKTYLKLEQERNENRTKAAKQAKKIGIVGLVIFMICVVLVIGLIIFISLQSIKSDEKIANEGIEIINDIFNNTQSKTQEQIQSEIAVLQNEINSIQVSIANVEEEIDSINADLAKLKAQQNTEFYANQFSEKYYTLDNEITKLSKSKSDKEGEIYKKKNQIELKQRELEKLEKELKNDN